MQNNDDSKESEDVPRRKRECTKKLFFDTSASLLAVFAGSLPENLKAASEALGVCLVSRDNWVSITAETEESLCTAENMFRQLQEMYKITRQPLLQHDFEQLLKAAAGKQSVSLTDYFSQRIRVASGKREIMPRTPMQLKYVEAMRKQSVVFGIGPAGTGKTYLAMAMAVSALLSGEQERIILTRPAVEAGESLGFLPGKIEEKINPYLRPLYDALYDMMSFAEAESLIERNIIEVAPLAFMRGRTLNHAFVILDEAQNATKEQMLMFLTRLGYQSKCVVCGDPTQTDLPMRKVSGLSDAIRRLNEIPEIAICRFGPDDVVRHRLVEKIITAYMEKKKDGTTTKAEELNLK